MTEQLFEKALGIEKPWIIESIDFDLEKKRLDISINFERGSKFRYESLTNKEDIEGIFPVHDTVTKTWRHLNFFQHDCYLICRVPRVKIDSKKVRQVQTPWEGLANGFTLLLEVFLLQLCNNMTVSAVSRITDIEDKRIWRMLEKYVGKAEKDIDMSDIKQIGIDETSMKKHHDYVTLVADMETHNTVFVTKGKDSKTINKFKESLENHGGKSQNITDASIDMSKAFIKGVKDNFENAEITFDKFHISKVIGEAVGEVRRSEVVEQECLKGTKYLFDKNRKNLTEKQEKALKELEMPKLNLKTVRALHIRENFQEIYKATSKKEFIELLEKWYSWARRCRLEPMKKAAKTIKNHWDGIVAWYDSKINNGILEGLNSLVQKAKNNARGFKNFNYFRIAIFLETGNLNFRKYNPFYEKA